MSHTRTVISLKSKSRRAKIIANCPNFLKITKWLVIKKKNGRLVTSGITVVAALAYQSSQLPVDH